jgi:hypothetical protein
MIAISEKCSRDDLSIDPSSKSSEKAPPFRLTDDTPSAIFASSSKQTSAGALAALYHQQLARMGPIDGVNFEDAVKTLAGAAPIRHG